VGRSAAPFWDRLRKGDGDACWRWVGAKDRNGYGSVWWEGRSRPAHRVAFELTKGPLPKGSSIRQTCGEHDCCRPDHLVEVPPIRRAPDRPRPQEPPRQRQPASRGRRPYGSGSLRQLRPNVWELRVATGGRNRFTGKYGEISRTFHGTKLEAEGELDRLRSVAHSARNRRIPKATAADLFDAYLEWLEHQVRLGAKSPTTVYKSYEPKIRVHLRPHLGECGLKQLLDGSVVNELYDAMLDEDWSGGQLSRANVASINRVLSAVFGWGMKQGWFAPGEDPRKLVDQPPVHRLPPAPCTPDEAVLLLEAAARSKRPEMERLIFLALVGGMRLGECCALRSSHVDWEKGRIKVQSSIIDIPGRRGEEKETKNYRNRDVYFDPVALGVLREQLSFMERRALAAEAELLGDHFLWSNEVDGSTPVLPSGVGQYFERLRDRVSLHHVRFKSLRSFMQTQTEDGGFPVSAAAARGGHDPAVLVRHYSQAQAETQRRISAALTRLVHPEEDTGVGRDDEIIPSNRPNRTRRRITPSAGTHAGA
jgi:integrase